MCSGQNCLTSLLSLRQTMQITETMFRVEVSTRYGDPGITTLRHYGCQWDPLTRVWWIGRLHPNVGIVRQFVDFARTHRSSFARECERRRAAGLSISTPFTLRQVVKEHGGIWDAARKQWLLPSPAALKLVRAQIYRHMKQHLAA